MRLASARWWLALTYISIAVRRNPKNPPATKSQRRVPTIGIVLHHEHDPDPGCCVDGGDDVAVSTLIGTLPNADIGGDPLSVAVKVTVYEPTSFADGAQEKWPVAGSNAELDGRPEATRVTTSPRSRSLVFTANTSVDPTVADMGPGSERDGGWFSKPWTATLNTCSAVCPIASVSANVAV